MNIELVEFEVVELEEFQDEYVYDLGMENTEEPWFFANSILVHNSCYLSLKPLEKYGYNLKDGNKISTHFYELCERIENYINSEMFKWASKSLLSKDSRLVFKREAICDVGIFVSGKNYVLHVLDDEGIPVDKFKYTGLAVVKTTMPKDIKPYVKKITETMLLTQSSKKTNDVYMEAYEVFKNLGVNSIYKNNGINDYENYLKYCSDFTTKKAMPGHAKAAYYHDILLDKLDIASKFEKFKSGDKVKQLYVKTPNKYGIDIIGFKYKYPKEFEDIFQVDYERMFEKVLFSAIETMYKSVGWKLRKPNENVKIELEDFFAED